MENNAYLFRKNLPFILLSIAFFLVFLIPFSMHGLAPDGRLYSCFSLDIAKHLSTVWKPLSVVWPVSYSENYSLMPSLFHEHPPLSFYIHSLFIQVFGGSIFVDKFYFFFMAFLSLALVVFWYQNHHKTDVTYLWIPVLSWLLIPENFLPAWDGGIEPTLVVFTTAACFLILCVCRVSDVFTRLSLLFIGSICIIAGFLTKGIQALFPLIVPIIYSLTIPPKIELKKGIQQCLFLVGLIAVLFSILAFIYPIILENIQAYFQQQIFGTFEGSYGSNIHMPKFINIFWKIFKNLILIIVLTMFMYNIFTKKHILDNKTSFLKKFNYI